MRGPAEKSGRYKLLVECPQEIPCDPCASACSTGAISLERELCSRPRVREELCSGCLSCLEACPVSCIYLMEEVEGSSLLTLALDRLPRPRKGDEVILKDARGRELGRGRVVRSKKSRKDSGLCILTVRAPSDLAAITRTVEVEGRGAEYPEPEEAGAHLSGRAEDFSVCRCEETSRATLKVAIEAGVRHARNLRRLTRMGLGLCQGRSCADLLLKELFEQAGCDPAKAGMPRARVPLRPVTLRELSGRTREE